MFYIHTSSILHCVFVGVVGSLWPNYFVTGLCKLIQKLKSPITLLAINSFWIFLNFSCTNNVKNLNLRLKMFLVHKCYLRSQALGCNVNGIRLASNHHWISSSFEKNTKSDLSRISRTFLQSLSIMLLWFTIWLKCSESFASDQCLTCRAMDQSWAELDETNVIESYSY